MIFLRSFGTKTKTAKEIFEQKIAKLTKGHFFRSQPMHLSRDTSEEMALGAGGFFFVIFAIFCADDFSSLLRHCDRKKAKDIFEQKIAKITKSHRL
jgi:hypothetical protein